MSYEHITTPTQVDEVLDVLERAVDNRKSSIYIALDTETTGLDPLVDKVLLIQISMYKHHWVFDVPQLGRAQTYRILHVIKHTAFIKVAHNAAFDYTMILGDFGISIENWRCTMVGSQLLSMGILNKSDSLEECLNKYLSIKIEKDQQKSFVGHPFHKPFTQEQLDYAAADTGHLIRLYNAIFEKIKDRDMETLYEIENFTIEVIGDMQYNGIYLNSEDWLKIEATAKKEAKEALAILDNEFKNYLPVDIFGQPTINYNSPLQLKAALQKATGLKNIKSTGSDELKKIKHPIIKTILEFRNKQKRITTYGSEFIKTNVHKKTGRVHSSFKQLGADSGRMSSRNPNMQNIPSEEQYRKCFQAQHPDTVLICADFSSQELALLAYISQEPEFITAINSDKDLHCYSASLIFGVAYEDFFEYEEDGSYKRDKNGDIIIKKDMKLKYRTPCKSITFGLMYGMGPSKLAEQLNITVYEAMELIEKYFETFPAVKPLLDKLVRDAKRNKYALSPLDGRRRLFSGVDWDHKGKVAHMMNVAKNQPFQGAGATITKLALCKIKSKLRTNGWDAKILLAVHDEIVLEAKKDQADIVAKALEDSMVEAFEYFAPGIDMKAKAVISNHWTH